MQENGGGRIYWNDDEYLTLAKALVEHYPSAHYDQAKSEADLFGAGLGTTEVRWVMQRSLPKDRWRRFAHLVGIRKPLLAAFARLRGEAVTMPRKIHVANSRSASAPVVWDDAEWDQFVVELAAIDPHLRESLDNLTLRAMNEAAAKMPRPRTFNAMRMAKIQIEPALARMRAQGFRASSGASSPQEQSPELQEKADKLFSRIFWTRDEWVTVARELHRMYPHQDYQNKDHLAGLNSQDVAFAQRVLPFERQRRHLKVVSFSSLKASLLTAFRDLKALDAADAARAAEQAAAAPPTPIEASAEPAQEAAPAAVDPYRAVFEPLVVLLVDAIAERLVPLVAEAVVERVMGRLPPSYAPATPVSPGPDPAPASALAQAAQALIEHDREERRPEQRVNKASIGILVNRTDTYRRELAPEFPQIEFKCIDSAKEVDTVRNCTKVVSMTRFVSHEGERKLKNAAGDRFVRCSGAMSELKRMINVWIASGDLPQQ